MKRAVFVFGVAMLGFSTPAFAGGGYCSPDWEPENSAPNCASQIAIAPGNDTRVNLHLLMQDRVGNAGAKLSRPDTGWGSLYGSNFFKWTNLREAWFSKPKVHDRSWNRQTGTRCQTIDSGKAAFIGAMNRNRRLKDLDKARLTELRGKLAEACKDGPGTWQGPGEGGYFANVTPKSVKRAANGYLAYLEGSAAFYSGRWDRAADYYAMIAKRSKDEWLKETALYMVARTALNRAISMRVNRWGDVDRDKDDLGAAESAGAAFQTYLSKYPEGRYAGSASGLLRKVAWLRGDQVGLQRYYADLIDQVEPDSEAAARLIEEVDVRFTTWDGDYKTEFSNVLMLATYNLQRMRVWEGQDSLNEKVLTAEELAAQADAFADHPELYSFLQATHAFYVQKDYKAVRDLLPDAAREDSYSPLAFSRQYLRGLALHALKDPNEGGFWLDLIKGADGVWQRQAVEMALARHYEQRGQLETVFAQGSPITDSTIRRILLGQSADRGLLKQVARDAHIDTNERSFALYTVLLKQLQYGQFSGMLEDFPLIEQFDRVNNDEQHYWDLFDRAVAPVRTFTEGTWSDGYPCPTLRETVQTLARNARDIEGRLCLGDFIRLNSFDDFQMELRGGYFLGREEKSELGATNYYKGEPLHRLEFYKSIIADRRATPEQRAYALYRGVWCYGPSGNNSCGSDVPIETRAQWFRQLKRDYPSSEWAQKLKYYW